MPTKSEIMTIPTASGQNSTSVHLNIRTNITIKDKQRPDAKDKTKELSFSRRSLAFCKGQNRIENRRQKT
jgi:hypothetical protein